MTSKSFDASTAGPLPAVPTATILWLPGALAGMVTGAEKLGPEAIASSGPAVESQRSSTGPCGNASPRTTVPLSGGPRSGSSASDATRVTSKAAVVVDGWWPSLGSPRRRGADRLGELLQQQHATR